MHAFRPPWLRRRDCSEQGRAFFVTWRLRGTHGTLSPPERDLVCEVLKHGAGDRYHLKAYVVMDDHVHVIVVPTIIPLPRLVHSWKSFTAHQMQRLHRRVGQIWLEGALQQPLVTDEELRQKIEYVVANPWKRWPFLKRYPWVWEA